MTTRLPASRCALITGALALLIAISPCSRAALAEDEAADGGAAALLAELATAGKDPNRSGMAEALGKAAGAFNGTTDAGMKKKIAKAVGKALRDAKGGDSRQAAAEALAQFDDSKLAFAELNKALPTPKDKEADEIQLAAIRAAGALKADAAIGPLTKLIEKSRALPAVKEAIVALGGYSESKKRVAILETLLDAMTRALAGAKAAAQNPKGGSGGDAWKELGESYVAACNALTGQKHADGEAWAEVYKANKKKLKALFPEE
jgi:hypothetical protein